MSANNISGVAADIEAGGLATLDARQDISLLNGTEQDKNDSYSTSAQRDSHSERSTSIGSRLDADRIEMQAGNDITLTNASVNAKTGIELGAGNNIAFNAVKNTNVSDFTDHNGINNSGRRVDVGTQLHNQSGEVRITAGNNVTGTVTQIINETGNTIIGAGNDVIFNEGRDETSSEGTRSWTKKRWYGKKTYTEHESKFSDTAVTSNITGDNVVISSNKGNVSLIGANVNAAQAAEVTAMKGAVTVQSAVDKSAKNTNRTTSNFYKGTGQQKGFERETLNETGISGNTVYVNGKNVAINGASLQARDGNLQIGDATLATDAQGNLQLDSNGKPIIESGSIDNLTFGTIELDSREWDEKQKAYKGIAKVGMQVAGVVGGALGITDSITISESSGTTTTSKDEAVSRLEGQNILVGGKTVTANGTQFTTTQAGGSTYVLGNDIDLGVATSTSTTTETAQKEVIGGEGVKLNSDSLQLGAVVRTDTEDTKTTTTGTNQGVTINSDNIVVLGDMTDGSLTTTAAKLNANQQTGSLLIGAKTTVLGGIEDTETVTQSNKTDTTRISVDVHHAAVDTISAAEQVKEAGSALAAAKNNLRDAKDRVSRGELSQDAIKDYEINLAAATLNLANAQINLGSVAAGAANTAGTLGFSASANVENTQTKTTDTQTQGKWQGTELNGANATFVGDDFTGVGLKGNIGQLNIDNLGSFTLNAGTNTSSGSSTSKTNSQTGSISTTGSASLGVSTQQSQSQAQGTTYTNSELNIGEFNGYAGTTNLTGGRINAGGGSYATDTLNIETVQDSASSSNKSSGGNLGINFAGGIPSGGSIGANKASGSSQSITVAEQSGIIYSGDNYSLTAGSTTNIGGIIANINTDSDGNQTNGNLNFTTGTLVTKDLINTATQEQKSIGGSLSTGKTATGVSLNNIGLQLGNTGQEFESKTLATIGQGAVVTGDMITGQDSLAGVNRDAFNTETIITDRQTGGLAVDTGIDTRVFTSAGREEIAKEQRELVKNIKTTGKITAAAGVQGVATAGNILSQNQTLSQAIQGLKAPAKMAQAIQNNPEIGAVLQGYQQGDYDGLLNSQAALQALADSTGVSVDVIITRITQELRAKGATDGQLVAIDGDISNREDVIKTTAHELDHVRGGSSETLANLAGIAANLNVSASMDANQDEIDRYKPALGDGRDNATQAENKELLNKNDITLITAIDKDPESFDYAVSLKQEFQYLGRFVDNDTAKAYMAIDKSQEKAHFEGSQEALKEFGENIVNAPANIKALYEATKDDPIAVAIEIGKALKNLPEEYYDMGKDITYASLLGNKDQDFYDAGKASTAIALEAAGAIISAGGAVVVKKVGDKIVGVEIKPPSRNPDKKPDRSNGNADYNANNSNNPNSNNNPNSQYNNILGNNNYFDSFDDNASDTRDYEAELQASKEKQKAENDKYNAKTKAENAKREADQKAYDADKKIQDAKDAAFSNKWDTDRAAVSDADRVKYDNLMASIGRPNTNSTTSGVNSTPNTMVINGNTYYPVDGGGYTTTKPSNTADRSTVDNINGNKNNNQGVDKPKSVFDNYTETTVLDYQNKSLDERAQFLSENVGGLTSEQAKVILERGQQKNTSIVIGGSRVRGDYTDISDIDIGYGNLSVNQTGKTNKQIARDSQNIEGSLDLEDTIICPGNCTSKIPVIQTPEEFFQREGARDEPNLPKDGKPYYPSGSISVYPDGQIVIIPPYENIKILK